MSIFLLYWIFWGLIGACVGSFLNVIIYRIPLEKSIWKQSSHCQSCGTAIPWYHNIPILSYCILRGYCNSCKKKFSIQYFLVELFCFIFFAFSFWYRFKNYEANIILPNDILKHTNIIALCLADCLLVSSLLAITIIDARYFIIPLELTLPTFIFALLLILWKPELINAASYLDILIKIGLSFVAGAWILMLVRFLAGLYYKREALGLGDIHLMIMLAVFMTWEKMLFIIVISALIGSIHNLALKLFFKKKISGIEIPYGPYLAGAAIIAYYFGTFLISWYLNFFSAK